MAQTIRVLVMKGEEAWVAQGIEHDIAGQGPTVEEAKEDFRRVLASEVWLRKDGFAGGMEAIPPAPEAYRRKYEEAEARSKRAVKEDPVLHRGTPMAGGQPKLPGLRMAEAA